MDVIIAVDFDGTIVEHKYPDIGKEVPGAISALKRLQQSHKLILWTMRSGSFLAEAVDYCRNHGIEFWGVNENPDQKSWTDSPKSYAQVYIDDAALGCPLRDSFTTERPMVDWAMIVSRLLEDHVIEV